MSYKNTYWKYSIDSIIKGKPRDVIFAVVRVIKDDNSQPHKLIAWEIELMSNYIRHPFYGNITLEDIEYYNLFTEGKGIVFPKVYFSPNDSDYIRLEDPVDFKKL